MNWVEAMLKVREAAHSKSPPEWFKRYKGICANAAVTEPRYGFSQIAKAIEIVSICAKDWSDYSGNPEFPVPYDNGHPEIAFYRTGDMWVGAYGARRMELLNHVIHKLQTESSDI